MDLKKIEKRNSSLGLALHNSMLGLCHQMPRAAEICSALLTLIAVWQQAGALLVLQTEAPKVSPFLALGFPEGRQLPVCTNGQISSFGACQSMSFRNQHQMQRINIG